MRTILYLICHAEAARACTLRDVASECAGTPHERRQATLTRDFLAVRSVEACYHAPHRRAAELAAHLAAAHALEPVSLDLAPARVAACYEALLEQHAGEGIVVVASSALQASYLAGLLGLSAEAAARLPLEPGGISIVQHIHGETRLATLNSVFHLQGTAAVTALPAWAA